MVYSTLLGSGQILPKALAIYAAGHALVSGLAADDSLKTTNAYQPVYLGGECTSCYAAFFAELTLATDILTAMQVDSSGNFYAAAETGSEPIQPLNAVTADVTIGTYYLELDPSGSPLQMRYSSFPARGRIGNRASNA